MKSKPLLFFILFLIGLFIFFKIDHSLRKGVLSLGDEFKSGVLNLQEKVLQAYEVYFQQAKTIKRLFAQNEELELFKLKNIELENRLHGLLEFYKMPRPNFANIVPVQILSYVEMGNYNRVWLGDYIENQDGFYGLVARGYVAGIAKKDENMRMVGYLNGDSLCSYGVYVGKNRALGIVRGVDGELKADFIPLGSEIAKGDEVLTNGLDEVFFPNIPVGKIVEINEENGYLSAKIEPYIQKIKLDYIWLLDGRKK